MKSIEEKVYADFARYTIEFLVAFKTGGAELEDFPDFTGGAELEDFPDFDYHIKVAKNLDLLKEARSLMSEPEDPNPEYDRGICELLAIQLGLPLQASMLEDCGAFKIGLLIDCCTIDSWGNV
jgi:hypothetical protein